jgi:hypothetical protein
MSDLESLDFSNTLPLVIRSLVGKIHTSTVGVVETFDGLTQRAQIRPLVNRVIGDKSLPYQPIDEVPVCFFGSNVSGFYTELKKGDLGLLVFSERSIDEAIASGVPSTPVDNRQFSLSDGVFIPGPLRKENLRKRENTAVTEMYNGASAVVLTEQTVAIGVGSVELLRVISDLLTTLAGTTVLVQGVPVPLSSAITFTQLKAEIETIRGQL